MRAYCIRPFHAARAVSTLLAVALTGALLSLPVVVSTAGPAAASPGAMDSAGPLTHIGITPDLNCAANHTGDTSGEFYGNTACGTLLAVGGVLYGPATIPAGGSAAPRTALTPVSQSAVTGSGTAADPYRSVTVADAGTSGMRVTQTDTYVVGQESWQTDVLLSNSSGTSKAVLLYRAFDCFRQNSDIGYGYSDLGSGSVACQTNQNQPSPFLEISPITSGSHFYEAGYDQVWAKIGGQLAFDDTCRCTENIDNGAGLSWNLTVAAGGSATRSERIVISLGTPVGSPLQASESFGGGGLSGNSTHCNTSRPVDCADGNFWHTFQDVTIPGRGPALDLSRTYNAMEASTDGPFGFGWRSTYTASLTIDGASNVTIHQENGSTATFAPDGTGGYSAPPRVFATLVHNGDGSWTFTRRARQIFVFDASGKFTAE